MQVGEIIKYWRLEFKYSQDALAKLIGTTQQTVSRWESNRHTPSIVECVKLSRALHLSLDEMFADLDVDW